MGPGSRCAMACSSCSTRTAAPSPRPEERQETTLVRSPSLTATEDKMNKAKLLLPLLLGAALPALAQTPANPPVSDPYARGYTAPHSPAAPTVNAVEGPVTDALNNQVANQTANIDSAQKVQYDKDMADYRAKVE